jgi:hypothetical protein
MMRWRWLPILLIAGYMIFAHGCHLGDHDDELRWHESAPASR